MEKKIVQMYVSMLRHDTATTPLRSRVKHWRTPDQRSCGGLFGVEGDGYHDGYHDGCQDPISRFVDVVEQIL